MPPRESEMEYLTRMVDWLVENEVYRAVIAANGRRPLPRTWLTLPELDDSVQERLRIIRKPPS